MKRPSKTNLGVMALMVWTVSACASGQSGAPTQNPTDTPAAAASQAAPTATQTTAATPLPATPVPTIPAPGVDNIYIGKDETRQPEALTEAMVPIVDISSLESYAGSHVEIFLRGMTVNEQPILGGAEMLEHLILLMDGARAAGFVGHTVYSSYRSYEDQKFLIGRGEIDYLQNTDQFLAEPGRSEHQIGTVVDLGWGASLLDPYITYNNEAAGAYYQWLKAHAHEYGFVISYPFKSNAEGTMSNLFEPWITEYKAETWHLRYVGVELATEIFEYNDEQGRNYLDPYSTIIPQQFYLP